MITHIFVYGTLKQGQSRSRLWPHQPLSIAPAWTYGHLYGRIDYPAMTPGGDRVAGQVWQFRRDQMPAVLRVLDRIEGTNQPGQADLYRRVEIETFRDDGAFLVLAAGYHYASDPAADGFQRMRPNEPNALVQWPGS